jgi:transcriptional regulator with XRE-family HTH domain
LNCFDDPFAPADAVQNWQDEIRFRGKDTNVDLGTLIRTAREEKNLSQGDLEQRTGMLRCYISRMENGHTVPSIETLEKIARALDMKLYQLLYDEERSSEGFAPRSGWGSFGKEARLLNKFRQLLPRITQGNRELLLFIATKLITSKNLRS